ncbi:hypothetical protein, partial [Bacteroides acidifaciens]
MTMGISSTGKDVQFEFNEGGQFNIYFSNPKDDLIPLTFLYELISDKTTSESIETVFGRDEKAIEHALRVLKDFLDSDEARMLLKKS